LRVRAAEAQVDKKNKGAKETTAGSIRDAGFDPVDARPLRVARYTEPFALLIGELSCVPRRFRNEIYACSKAHQFRLGFRIRRAFVEFDAKLRIDMRTEIKELDSAPGTTVVYVTHDQIEAMTLATRIAIMKDGLVQQKND